MFSRWFAVVLLVVLSACARPQAPGVYQYAAFGEFASGQYAGTIPLSELSKRGDFGIGTIHRMDGEMVVLDGVFHRAGIDLAVTRPDPSTLSPFANLVFFRPEASAPLSLPGGLKDLGLWLDERLPGGAFAAARVEASFRKLTIRSIPGYQAPYPDLAEALKSQHVQELTDASGTLVCMRGPDKPSGVWVPGWHIHFLSADGQMGGHVLAFEGLKGQAAWMASRRYTLELPPGQVSGSPQ